MNSQLRSLENSPSFQIFQQNSSMSPLIYDLDDSLIPMSRNKYELSFSSSAALGGSASFDLLRVGLLNAIILKLRFTGFATSSVGHFGGGYNVIKEVSILSHNKKLLRMNRNNIQQKIGKMPYHVRRQIESSAMMMGVVPNDHDDSTAATQGTRAATPGYFNTNSRTDATTYLYIPFSIFDDLRTACSWNMEFLENLTLQIDFEEGAALATGGTPVLDTSNSKVIVSYYDLRNSDMKKFEQANYKVDDNNLSLVLKDYYTETSPAAVALDGDSATLANRTTTFSVPIQCRSLITSIYVRVQNTDDQNGLEGVRVEEISLNLDGKEFVKYKAEELQLLTAVVGGVSVGNNYAQRLSSTTGTQEIVDGHENYYELKFNVNQSNAFSSALSARSVGQPELKVKIFANTNDSKNYKCFVECEHISLLSISSTDGKIQKSQNL
ncbi:MAG: hypothetical protein CL525_13240 [Aequorivita sp.]|nr:hypothetical protein [Aequorivita sp.]